MHEDHDGWVCFAIVDADKSKPASLLRLSADLFLNRWGKFWTFRICSKV